MTRLNLIRLGVTILAIGLLAVLGGLFLAKPAIPRAVSSKASFPIFLPKDQAPGLVVDKNSITYDDQNHGINFRVALGGTTVTLTEQATPDSFADGPAYSYLLTKSHQYDTVKTNTGDLALTHPTELNGGQLAIVNPAGTLIFAKPDKELTQAQWAQLFNAMRRL